MPTTEAVSACPGAAPTLQWLKRVAVALLAGISMALPCRAQTLALTFDDGLDPGVQVQAREWNAAILAALRAQGLRAMLFPSPRLTGAGAGRELVRQWAAEGHAVGNHTGEHRSLHEPGLSAAAFIGDVEAAEAAFGTLPTWQPLLRFPFLHEGDSAHKRDAVRAWMRTTGYRHGYVSIDTADWQYADMLARLPPERAPQLLPVYLDHLMARANWYRTMARQVLGREPHHVLLLHTNGINARWLGEVIARFEAAGWTFVDPEQAYADPLYAREPPGLPADGAIVWALAREAGIETPRYPPADAAIEQAAQRLLAGPR